MWLVRSILIFAGIVAVLAFAIANVDQKVTLHLLWRTYENIYLNLVLLCAFLFGAALCFAVMVFREFSLRVSLRRVQRENMRLDDELTALRNLPLASLETSREKARPRATDR